MSKAGVPFEWLRQVDIACDLFILNRGMPVYTFKQKITMDASEAVFKRRKVRPIV